MSIYGILVSEWKKFLLKFYSETSGIVESFFLLLNITTEKQTLKKVLLSMFVVIQRSILIYSPNLSINHEFFASSVCRLSFLSTWSKNLLFRILFQPRLLKYLGFKRKRIKKIKMIDCSKPFKYQFAIQIAFSSSVDA